MSFDPKIFDTVEEHIPEELPESSGWSWIGEIVSIGVIPTPEFKAEAARIRGEKPREKMFVQVVKPLDFEYDTNPDSWIYQQQGNFSVVYCNYLDRNGNLIGPNSPFGELKNAYKALGFSLTNKQSCDLLVGKKFRFLTYSKKFMADASKAVWLDKPIELLPDDYVYTGPKREPRRRGYEGAYTAANYVSPERELADVQKLKEVLNGKAPNEFIMAIIAAGLDSPYIDEATNGGASLISRMQRHGMRFENGRLLA